MLKLLAKIEKHLYNVQAVGMMTANHNYLITSLDLHLVDLEDFKYGGTNITAFRLVDPAHPEVGVNISEKILKVDISEKLTNC